MGFNSAFKGLILRERLNIVNCLAENRHFQEKLFIETDLYFGCKMTAVFRGFNRPTNISSFPTVFPLNFQYLVQSKLMEYFGVNT